MGGFPCWGIYAQIFYICTGGRRAVQYRDENLLRAGKTQIFRKILTFSTTSFPVVFGKSDWAVANLLAGAALTLEGSQLRSEWLGNCQISRPGRTNFAGATRIKYHCSFCLTLDICFFPELWVSSRAMWRLLETVCGIKPSAIIEIIFFVAIGWFFRLAFYEGCENVKSPNRTWGKSALGRCLRFGGTAIET